MRPGVPKILCAVIAAGASVGPIGVLGALGCGSGGAAAPDGGAPPTLDVETPPGDSIGLAPGDQVTLRVRLRAAGGAPIAGAPITWRIVGGAAGTGGATLAAATTVTLGDGLAEDDLTAGPARVDFQVAAQAADSPEARFYVSVSAAGFADVAVTPLHVGGRGDGATIELRAYRGALDCGAIAPDAPPASPLPPRTLPGFGAAAVWPGLAAGEAYTIVAWLVHATSGRAIAWGCAPIAAAQALPGEVRVALAVTDRPLVVGASTLTTHLDLAPLGAAEAAAGVDRPWRALACPLGGGQLALDWIVDALAADGALDGVTTNPTGAAATLAALRGAVGADGCRAATRAGGGASLDATVDDAIGRGGFPGAAARAQLAAARAQLLGEATVTSTLAPGGAAAIARHTLGAAQLGGVVVPLAASARPVIAADVAWSIDASGELRLGSHAFTARLGAALGAAFAAGPLAAAGLGAEGDALGTALVGAARAPTGGDTGCQAVDDVVCAAAGLTSGCARAACQAAAPALDAALAAWWRDGDGAGLDLALAGVAHAADADGDLVIDPIADGLWTATLTPAAGAPLPAPIATTGTWTSTAASP